MTAGSGGAPAKRLIVLFGPAAVGKMTVGRELARLTGLRLFHNHMAIEPVLELFDFGSPPFVRLVRSFREGVFREVADSALPGLIFTYMWALDVASDRRFVDDVCEIFRARGAAVHFVELYAPLEVRLRRNRTEAHLAEKPSKRDVEASERRLLANDGRLRLNTDGVLLPGAPPAHRQHVPRRPGRGGGGRGAARDSEGPFGGCDVNDRRTRFLTTAALFLVALAFVAARRWFARSLQP